MGQKFHYGDHVKVSENYSTGGGFVDGVAFRSISRYAGQEAIVIASYSDSYDIPNSGGGYTLFFGRGGRCSWFPEDELEMIEERAMHVLERFAQERREYLDEMIKAHLERKGRKEAP